MTIVADSQIPLLIRRRLVKIFVGTSERATTKPLGHMMDYPCAIIFIGHAFCPLSQVLSIKNCCCEMNTWWPRIAFSEHTCQPASALSDAERSTLAEIAKRLGRKALQEIARVAKPDTLLAWYRQLVAHKFDGSRRRGYPGRPRRSPEMERLVVRMAGENRGWRYDRIVAALANLGHAISDRTVGNILRRHNIAPAPERSRKTSWKEFIRSHMEVLAAADFFTVEVLTWRGLVTYYVLFFIEIGTR